MRRPGKVVVHQVRKLTSLGVPGPGQPAWAKKMAQMRRKTLVVCASCHDPIHATTCHESGIGHWRATCIERCPRGSEEGSAEKAFHTGRHLAALPILSPVLRT